ncbi:MAG: 2-octaprenyl-6-methoxyphenol 4-monooxygenase [Aphanocapsa feldmannii 277cV]|uniref:2-octaprenyl-6-methoxyphenol 4-monooxygenase n=1 Tax=Aphanocapsa feldmannii 277cV TaxID=2507553 RepID=A0A524RMI6_9CHRO|nr:MAG: 2-octaprenyl-6-methoxyphenol 4-monooxygenase [Aphanocapsa feldmannii 277cV]
MPPAIAPLPAVGDGYRALVAGAGPSGSLAALGLAAAGWTVTLVDPLQAEGLEQRRRVYALTHSSQQLLEGLGLWQLLAPHCQPFSNLRLCDPEACGHVRFGMDDLPGALRHDKDVGKHRQALGWTLAHAALMRCLLRHCADHPAIDLRLGQRLDLDERQQPLIAGRPCGGTPLLLLADGHGSPLRRCLGIPSVGWSYGQVCVTSQVQIRSSRPWQAWEQLRAEGPFALLPLGGDLQQIVWSAPPERARQLTAMDPNRFLDALADVLPPQLQPQLVAVPAQQFPVQLRLALRLRQGRCLLIGEAAHCSHPVGGQGMNLCWRDVQTLLGLARACREGHISETQLLRRYPRRRWPDLLTTLLATDLLVRTFSNRNPLLLPLRQLMMGLLNRSVLLRRCALGAMTLGLLPPGSRRRRRRPGGSSLLALPGRSPWR